MLKKLLILCLATVTLPCWSHAGARRFTYVYESTTAAPGAYEFESWVTWKTERDPVINMERVLTALGIVDAAALATIQTEIQNEMDVAVKFAVDAPYPAPDKVDQDVYA